jgi:hypothetical protein
MRLLSQKWLKRRMDIALCYLKTPSLRAQRSNLIAHRAVPKDCFATLAMMPHRFITPHSRPQGRVTGATAPSPITAFTLRYNHGNRKKLLAHEIRAGRMFF